MSASAAASAAKFDDHGVPELQQAVERGEVSVSGAADVRPSRPRSSGVCGARRTRDSTGRQQIRGARAEARRAERIARCRGQPPQSPLPEIGNSRYRGRIRPWRSRSTTQDAASSPRAHHYPTIELGDILHAAGCRPRAPDAVLFMWTTRRTCARRSWCSTHGASTTSPNLVWVQGKLALGFWVRNQHELLIVGRRGDMPTPSPANRPPSVITRRAVSTAASPTRPTRSSSACIPNCRRSSLFARRGHARGLGAWGNEGHPPARTDPMMSRTSPTSCCGSRRERAWPPAESPRRRNSSSLRSAGLHYILHGGSSSPMAASAKSVLQNHKPGSHERRERPRRRRGRESCATARLPAAGGCNNALAA